MPDFDNIPEPKEDLPPVAECPIASDGDIVADDIFRFDLGSNVTIRFIDNHPQDLATWHTTYNSTFAIPNCLQTRPAYDITKEEISVVEEFEKGFKIVSLLNDQALFHEGTVMDHCVAQYVNAVVVEKICSIYSLRDVYNEPHATLEIVPSINNGQYVLSQIKGRCNSTVKEKYWPYLQLFIYKNLAIWNAIRELHNIGLVYTTKGLYRANNHPQDAKFAVNHNVLEIEQLIAIDQICNGIEFNTYNDITLAEQKQTEAWKTEDSPQIPQIDMSSLRLMVDIDGTQQRCFLFTN